MKLIRTVGLCLVAVFALSVVAASTASAADLLARPAGGGSIVGVSFLSSAGLAKLVTKAGSEIDCTDVTNHGLFLSATLGNILIRFLGCQTVNPLTKKVVKCKTTGAATGEIHLPLTTLFHLGLAHLVLSTVTDRVPAAVILSGNIELECEGITVKVKGNVIGALQSAVGTPQALNTPFSSVLLNFEQTSNGIQQLKLILMPGSTAPTEFFLESTIIASEQSSEVVNDKLDEFTLPSGAVDKIEFVEP